LASVGVILKTGGAGYATILGRMRILMSPKENVSNAIEWKKGKEI
jgi:hypothetical protein